jgi:hypothetical protein
MARPRIGAWKSSPSMPSKPRNSSLGCRQLQSGLLRHSNLRHFARTSAHRNTYPQEIT